MTHKKSKKEKSLLKRIGEATRKGIEFEKKAFKFGGKAISKGWEYGFEKSFEMRDKMQREMEKQREEMGY
jgi:hypothetical protein